MRGLGRLVLWSVRLASSPVYMGVGQARDSRWPPRLPGPCVEAWQTVSRLKMLVYSSTSIGWVW